MADTIVDGTNIDVNVFSYSAPKPHASGGKVVNLYNKHFRESLTLSTPLMLTWGAQEGQDTNTNLHVLWDSNLIDDFKMSFTEWSNHLQNKFGKKEIQQKNVLDWTFESHWYARDIYKNTPPNSYLSYDYVYQYQPILEKRLYQAGVRLGNLLNEIFGDEQTN